MTSQTNLRPDIDALPLWMLDLPVDPERHIPVPWFVPWIDGKPEFRAGDAVKRLLAVQDKRCWVCGKKLGAYLVYVIGAMCGINRTTSEPACHQACARWSARNCPFLSRPRMVRRDDGEFEEMTTAPGEALTRNPGVTLLWTTKSFRRFSDGRGGWLIEIGEPLAVEWWAERRPATRAEVEESVRTGLPFLENLARLQPGAMEALHEKAAEFTKYYPAEHPRGDQ
jgi:hypothetical protein